MKSNKKYKNKTSDLSPWARNPDGPARKAYKAQWARERRESDPLFAMKQRLRVRLANALRRGGWSKESGTEEIVGCSFERLEAHLISTALSNYGFYVEGLLEGELALEIDHCQCLAGAENDLEEILWRNRWVNLQFLTKRDNLKKLDKETWDVTPIRGAELMALVG